ncbi:hypothetical protein [Longimicrobium sp.]|uniref:hypothetical protein n=1 Tax=Longimicrobium sp. TaxID=2029185 RepID=UPI002E2FE38B|nr:hypothetical protein [Longimicrobium sp.]HEX6039810.1 hypothetical protein [Longimicrobium sp.]
MRSIALAALVLVAACGSNAADETAQTPDSIAVAAPEGDSAAPAATDTAPAPTSAWTLRLDGAGPVRVGMTFDEAKAALGGDLRMNDDNPQHPEGPDRCDYPRSAQLPAGVMLMVQGQRVVRVEVDSGAVTTAEGARIGDTEARVQQLYPGRVTVSPHKYTDGHYLTVRPAAASDTTHLLIFETDGRVVQRVRAGQKPQVEYVEGCS